MITHSSETRSPHSRKFEEKCFDQHENRSPFKIALCRYDEIWSRINMLLISRVRPIFQRTQKKLCILRPILSGSTNDRNKNTKFNSRCRKVDKKKIKVSVRPFSRFIRKLQISNELLYFFFRLRHYFRTNIKAQKLQHDILKVIHKWVIIVSSTSSKFHGWESGYTLWVKKSRRKVTKISATD